MHQGDAGAPGGLSAGDGLLFPADIERLLARSDAAMPETPDDRRARRDDLTLVLAALAVAGEVLSADVAVLRRCSACDAAPGPGNRPDLVDALPAVLAARPWGRGWSAPPHPRPGEDEDPAILLRAGPLWSSHLVMASLDPASGTDVAAALARIEDQLVALCAWRSAVEDRLAAVRAAIVGEWSGRINRSLETPA